MLRRGERRTVTMRLVRIVPEAERVPPFHYDAPPEHVLHGGLVFQHLSLSYLRSFGKDWRKRAPLRLLIAEDLDGPWPTPEHPRVVVLTRVLPDAANLGYQDLRDLVVATVNGTAVRTLEDVGAALARPQNGFHVIEFVAGQATSRIVLDAAEAAAADERIRERYGVGR